MDQFGDTHSIYVWPINHLEGTAYPKDFYVKLNDALKGVGIDWESE